MTEPPLRQLFIESLTLPRAAARRVVSYELSSNTVYQAAIAVVIAGTMLGWLMQVLVPAPAHPVAAFLIEQPITAVFMQIGLLVLMAFLAAGIGRWFGGSGEFLDAMKLMVWIQAVMVVLQAGQFILLLILPVVAALANIAAIVWFFWALSTFIAELHGFQSALKVLGGVFISFLVILIAAGMVLTLAGVQMPEPV